MRFFKTLPKELTTFFNGCTGSRSRSEYCCLWWYINLVLPGKILFSKDQQVSRLPKADKEVSNQNSVSRSKGSFMLVKSENRHQKPYLTVNMIQDSLVCKLEGQETQVKSLWSLTNWKPINNRRDYSLLSNVITGAKHPGAERPFI